MQSWHTYFAALLPLPPIPALVFYDGGDVAAGFEGLFDDGEQVVDVEGFVDDVDALGHEVAFLLAYRVEGGCADDDGNRGCRGFHFEHLKHLEAGLLTAKNEVQDDEVRADLLDIADLSHGEAG